MVPLIILFGFSVAVSILWICGSLVYLSYNIGIGNLFTLAPTDLLSYLAVALLPPIALWFCIGFVNYTFSMYKLGQRLQMMFAQLRRGADQSEAMIRTLLEAQNANNNMALIGNLDLIVRDLNEILADVCVRLGLLQNSAVDALWARVGDGNVWVFCKVILANSEMNAGFERLLRSKLRQDQALVRNITEFEERFDCLLSLLEESEAGSFVANTLREGYMGRVYDSLSSVVEDVSDDIAFVNKHTAFKATPTNEETIIADDIVRDEEDKQASFALSNVLEESENTHAKTTADDGEPTYYISRPTEIKEDTSPKDENTTAKNSETLQEAEKREDPIIARDASQEWAHRRHDYMTSYPATDK